MMSYEDTRCITNRERNQLAFELEATYIKYLDNFLAEYGKAWAESPDDYAKPDVVLNHMEIPDHYLAVWAKHLMMKMLRSDIK